MHRYKHTTPRCLKTCTATARHSHIGASHVRDSSPDTHRPSPRAAASPSRTGHRPRTNQQQIQSAAPSRPSAFLPCPLPDSVRLPMCCTAAVQSRYPDTHLHHTEAGRRSGNVADALLHTSRCTAPTTTKRSTHRSLDT